MARRLLSTRRRLLHTAGFAVIRGATYSAGSTAMTGLLLWLMSR